MFSTIIFAIIIIIILYAIADKIISKSTISNIERNAVLITGSGGGFGKALVIKCLNNGFTVFAGCHREVSAKELENDCKGLPGQLYAFHMDVACDRSVAEAKQYIETKLHGSNQKLVAIVNNAGIRGNHFNDDFLTLEDYSAVWQVNVYGAIRVTQSFKDLIKQSRGRIVMCSSACTLMTIPSYGPYASSKAALNAYADVIRHELQPFEVKVITMMPGSFESGMQDTDRLLTMVDTVWQRASSKLRTEYGHDYANKVKKRVIKMQSTLISNNVSWVIDSYYAAITAKDPKLIYRIGWDTILFFHLYSMLPVQIQVYVMRFLLRIIDIPQAEVTRSIYPHHNQ